MDANAFVSWLRGFLDAITADVPSPEQMAVIREKLSKASPIVPASGYGWNVLR